MFIKNKVPKLRESMQAQGLKSIVPKGSIQENKSTKPKDDEKEKLNNLLNTTLPEESKPKDILAKEQVISQKVNPELINGKSLLNKI